MKSFPQRKKDVQLAKFVEYLRSRGAEILPETNQWELLRFRSGSTTSVVYFTKNDVLTWTGDSSEAYQSFISGGAWKAVEPAARPAAHKKPPLVRALLQRDGANCFYCGRVMEDGAETLEHLCPVVFGGVTHISNLALAHRKCNEAASNKSVVEKILLRETLQLRKSRINPSALVNLEIA